MSQYKVIKLVDFGQVTIRDKDFYYTKLQNYAPPVGTLLQGEPKEGWLIGNKVTGIEYPIYNGPANGQQTIQTIPLDHLELVVVNTSGNGSGVIGEPSPDPIVDLLPSKEVIEKLLKRRFTISVSVVTIVIVLIIILIVKK